MEEHGVINRGCGECKIRLCEHTLWPPCLLTVRSFVDKLAYREWQARSTWTRDKSVLLGWLRAAGRVGWTIVVDVPK